MMELNKYMWDNNRLIRTLKNGGVAVIPTDTVYGIVGKAGDREVVENIYKIRKRSPSKPCIILISDVNDLSRFSVDVSRSQITILNKYWPGSVSIILECLGDKYEYLHRGTNTLAFRFPQPKGLIELLKETGPLIAPSANPEGQPVSKNIKIAKEYFKDKVDLYVDGGDIEGKPSKIILLNKEGEVEIIRD